MMYHNISKSDIDNIKDALSDKDNVNIYNSNLSGYDFSKFKKLQNVSFMSCNMKDCNFSNMILKGIHFGKSNIENIDFSGAKVQRISIDSSIDKPDYWDSIKTNKNSFFGHTFFKIDKRFRIEDSTWFEPILLPLLERMYPNEAPSGDFEGYKVCNKCMITLKVPKYTKRLRMPNGTIRVSRAEVIKIIPLDENALYKAKSYIASDYDPSFIYKKGEIVRPSQYCTDRWINGPGIHLFDNKDDALLYHLYKQNLLSKKEYLRQDLTIKKSDY